MLISLNSTEEYDNQDQDDYLNQTDYQDQGHDYHDDLDYQSEDCTPVSCGMHSNINNNQNSFYLFCPDHLAVSIQYIDNIGKFGSMTIKPSTSSSSLSFGDLCLTYDLQDQPHYITRIDITSPLAVAVHIHDKDMFNIQELEAVIILDNYQEVEIAASKSVNVDRAVDHCYSGKSWKS